MEIQNKPNNNNLFKKKLKELKKSVVAPYYKLLGTIHGIRMALDMKKYYIVTVISAVISAVFTFVITVFDFFEFEKSKISIYNLIVICAIIILFSIFKGFYDYKKTADTHTAIRDEYYKSKVLEKIKISERMKEAGYEIMEFNNGRFIEKYVMSHKSNNYLYTNADKISLKKLKNRYKPIDEIKDYIPFAISALLRNNKVTFNGSNVRQMQEIYPDMKSLYVQPARYFDGQCTNELTYAKLNDTTTLAQEFEGKQLLCNKDNEMYEMDDSPCSNYIGMSTLVVTRDNYLIIPRQGNLSNANSGRLAPSGSGSAGKADFRTAKSLKDLLTIAMEREFREECNVSKRFKMTTDIIGYARLLERGGKPDFFGVSLIDGTKDEIGIKNIRIFENGTFAVQEAEDKNESENIRILENGLTSSDKIILIKLDNCVKGDEINYKQIAKGLGALISKFSGETENPQISIQLHIMNEIIENSIFNGN